MRTNNVLRNNDFFFDRFPEFSIRSFACENRSVLLFYSRNQNSENISEDSYHSFIFIIENACLRRSLKNQSSKIRCRSSASIVLLVIVVDEIVSFHPNEVIALH